MWDNNSNAKVGVISFIENLFKIISLRKFALTSAALVVPGVTLYIKNCIDSFLSM